MFPTDLRGDAFAWSNNLIGRLLGSVPSPALLGLLAETMGGWGPAIRLIALSPIISLLLILWWLPETNAKKLEETARLH